MKDCVTLWIGDPLGRVERACLRSVLRQGHHVVLYVYDDVDGVPEGVEVRDAADVLPRDRIVRYPDGGVALFSNWFRYELLRRGAGTWIDTDQYLVAPIDPDRPYVFGYESDDWIAIGVLRLPPDSPVLAPLLAQFAEQARDTVADLPWGTTGPKAVTALLREHGLTHWAYPPEVLYPVHFSDAGWICDPQRSLDDVLTPTSIGVHLWNERIKAFKDAPPPPGSFLARLHDEGA